ncbi:MAG: GNAT family N-acetyltransferase [Clostridia bacterium]
MRIRMMYPTEGKKLAELLFKSVHTLCINDYTPRELEAWAPEKMDMVKFNSSLLRSANWVMSDGDKIVGFINIERDGYVNRLFTHPEYTRRGIATALLETAIAWAKKKGLKRVFLAASKTGYSFYKKRGFRVIGVERVERRGVVFENRIMEKFI